MDILIVDHSEVTIRLINDFLTSLQHTLHIATTGAEAIRLNMQRNYALLFLAIELPDVDGLTITKQLRAWYARKSFLPIIGLTSYSDHEFQQACFNAGMNDCLTKPIQKAQLQTTLAKYTNAITLCEFITPWYKPGTLCKICTGGNS